MCAGQPATGSGGHEDRGKDAGEEGEGQSRDQRDLDAKVEVVHGGGPEATPNQTFERGALAGDIWSVVLLRARNNRMLGCGVLRLVLVTLGDPDALSGGYLYHRRMAAAAARHDASLAFVSLADWPFPLPMAAGGLAARSVARLRPDAVLIDSIAAAYLAPAVGALQRRVPLVGVLHQPPGGMDHGGLRTRAQRALDLATYRRLDAMIVASQALADDLAKLGAWAAPVWVVPPGRDPARVAEAAPDPRRGRRIAVLCVANWQERKGVLDLLEALARLPERTATLHLVGDPCPGTVYGWRVRKRIQQPDVQARVVAHGRLPPERVAGLYAGVDVFCLPSLREPYGTVYGEALAAGLPVVGYAAGNLPNLIEHQREGLLAAPGSVAELSEALRGLAEDEAQRLRLGTAARDAGARLPTWTETAARFFACVRRALERR
jgi:glycosyltransferase involved in cell wall biosynthesis